MTSRAETIPSPVAERGAGRSRALDALGSDLPLRLAGSILPFLLVVYLALKGGGYDAIVRSEVGVVIWWIVLLGVAVGVLPAARIGRAAWIGLAALTLFAAWTAIGVSWSESSERSVAELARIATYVGVFVLAVCIQGRDGLRRTVNAVAAGLALVALLSLLSRLHPAWFPANEASAALEEGRKRLNYPINYWNGLATLMAIAAPLLVVVAVESRRILTQAVATAALPIVALVAFYTFSRGGAIELAVGLALALALHPRRLAILPTLTLGVIGSVLVIVAASQRDALEGNLSGATALEQGDQMLALVLVVCVGIGLLRAAVGLVARHGLGPRPRISRPAAVGAATVAVIAALIAALAAEVPAELSDRWQEFKQPEGPASDVSRFSSASGNNRYQLWQTAVDANAADPLTGIGPGTYEFFFAREGTITGYVKDAHSLYLEALAELGVVGFALIVSIVLGITGFAAWGAVRAPAVTRPWLAAAAGGCAAFAVAAGIDWVWEVAVIPVVFLLLAAAALARAPGDERPGTVWAPPPATRAAIGAIAVAGLIAIAIPLAGTRSVRASEADLAAKRLDSALANAETAQEIQPYAASASVQRALVQESAGDLDGAAASARRAAEQEAGHWRTWLLLSRIEAYRGNAAGSVRAYREAKSLNPRSPLFTGQPETDQ